MDNHADLSTGEWSTPRPAAAALLVGGLSAEREVSLSSGSQCIAALREANIYERQRYRHLLGIPVLGAASIGALRAGECAAFGMQAVGERTAQRACTPADVVGKLHQEVRAVIADPEVHQEFVKLGLAPVQSPPADLPGFIKSEIAVWGEIIRRAGLAGSQ